jgi:HK97 family phage major capsid protein
MQTLQELKFNRNKILTDMSALASKPWTTESRTAFDKMSADVTVLDGDVLRAEQMAAHDSNQASFTRSARPGIGDGKGINTMSADEKRSKVSSAFRSYILNGRGGMSEEQRDLLTTGSAGALIPQEFYPVLTDALKFYGPIVQELKQRVTPGSAQPLKISLVNDTVNSLTLIGEGTTVTETDPTFQSRIVGADLLSSGLVKVSVQELEDSSFDLTTWLRDAFSLRYGRGIEAAVTNAKDGSSTTLPSFTALTSIATVAATTATLAGGIGWGDLTSLYGGLDVAYLPNAKWSMTPQTRNYLVSLKDGFGRPFFTPDPSGDKPFQSIMGYPIVLNSALPQMGASKTPIQFGDYRSAALFRTDGEAQLVVLQERYMDTLEKGFFLYQRAGVANLDAGTHPLASLAQAAS